MLLVVPSLEGHENFLEAVPVIAKIPLALLSLEGHGKLGTTRTTVWFTIEYCQSIKNLFCMGSTASSLHKHDLFQSSSTVVFL